MVNKYLKKTILETVENQLQMNEPKCTKETLQRLVTSGIQTNRAKEMIAAVLLEEMYYILKDDEIFSEQRYAQKLSNLENDTLLEAENDYESFSMQELIQDIEYIDGTFPELILQEIIKRKEEAIPFLLDILKKVLKDPQEYTENDDYFGHIYAAYLLAQFRVTKAYPIFIEILRLPDELPHELFGDVICEASSRILASIWGKEIMPIKELITDIELDVFIRGSAVMTLAILVLHGELPREDVMEYYRTLLTGGLPDNNTIIIAEVVSSCNNLYPGELMDEIRSAYLQELVDDSYIDLESVEETLALGKEQVLETYKKDTYHQYINDTIEELEGWACFHEDSFIDEDSIEDEYIYTPPVLKDYKPGRNDPCSCGSGKKYKKCCMLKE